MMRALIILFATTAAVFAQTDGRLIGAYLMPGYSAPSAMHDMSGRITSSAMVSNSATHIGGSVYYFAGGTGSRIQFAAPQIVSTCASFTVIASFNITNSNAIAAQAIFSEVNQNDVTATIELAVFNSRLELFIRCRVGAGNVSIDLVPTNNVLAAWNHVAWQCDRTNGTTGATARIYLNGVQIGLSNAPAFTAVTGVLAQAVGLSPRTTPVSAMTGMVARVLTFSRSISSNEVVADYIKWRATRR